MLRVLLCRGHEQVFEGPAVRVVLPGEDGEVSVFAFHAPMLCTLGTGEVVVDEARFPVRGGVARVARDAVTILAC